MKEKICLFKLNIHYITNYIAKKLVQELSTSTSNKLTTRSTSLAVQTTRLPGWSDRQATKKAV